mgnify:CR=1 FL=1
MDRAALDAAYNNGAAVADSAQIVADWRRRMFGLYAGVRHLSVHDPAAGHELWKSGRRPDLFERKNGQA